MIVVDTSVIINCVVGGEDAKHASAALMRDPEWLAPTLWRSEFCNYLATQMRFRGMPEEAAKLYWRDALDLLADRERQVEGELVIHLAANSSCTAYDCEFVALARSLSLDLVTTDKQVLKAFPGIAVSLSAFAKG